MGRWKWQPAHDLRSCRRARGACRVRKTTQANPGCRSRGLQAVSARARGFAIASASPRNPACDSCGASMARHAQQIPASRQTLGRLPPRAWRTISACHRSPYRHHRAQRRRDVFQMTAERVRVALPFAFHARAAAKFHGPNAEGHRCQRSCNHGEVARGRQQFRRVACQRVLQFPAARADRRPTLDRALRAIATRSQTSVRCRSRCCARRGERRTNHFQ